MDIKRTCQFLLDKEKGKEDAKLRYRIKWNDNKNIVAFNLGFRVEPDKWSKETQRCKNNTTHGKKKVAASIINRAIGHFEQLSEQAFNSFEMGGNIPSAEEFRTQFNSLNGKEQTIQQKATKGFFDIFDEFTKTMGFMNSWSNETFVKFASIRGHLYSFDSELSLDTLSDYTMQLYTQHLLKVPLRNTTIAKNLAFVRWFLRWAYNNEYYKGLLHNTYKPRLKGVDGNTKEVIHLTWDELIHLYDLPIPETKNYLARVRDVFCFCCFTSLRYSDVEKLRRVDIKGETIAVVTKKTVDSLVINLNNYSKAILEKYADTYFDDDKALPVISNSNMNEYLKELGKLAGFDEPQRIVYFIGSERKEEVYPKYALLTTHCGRRTFIVNALFLGIPAEVVMKWTGHSDYKAMKPYVKIVDELKVQEMDKFNR